MRFSDIVLMLSIVIALPFAMALLGIACGLEILGLFPE